MSNPSNETMHFFIVCFQPNLISVPMLGMPNFFFDRRLQKRVNEGNMFDRRILKRNSETVDDNTYYNDIKRSQQKRRLFLPKQYWKPKALKKSFVLLPSQETDYF